MKEYFGQHTEDAIADFQRASTPEERNRIYTERIHASMEKLVNDVFSRYGSPLPLAAKQDLLTDLYMRLDRCAPGTVFGYLFTTAKGLLFHEHRRMNRHIPLDHGHDNEETDSDRRLYSEEELFYHESQLAEEQAIIKAEQEERELKRFVAELFAYMREQVQQLRRPASVGKLVVVVAGVFEGDQPSQLNYKAVRAHVVTRAQLTPEQFHKAFWRLRKMYRCFVAMWQLNSEFDSVIIWNGTRFKRPRTWRRFRSSRDLQPA